ncbi:hypothetical protein [Natronobacterium gregoryi]|uniref:Uncharacterized protein n=3 Tax=Natronobacterium gregoryi TaxID=44930 RepID=L0AJ23_NATGS|nr:hypothetical protein [Natronobacterium gregoryi]AFZ73903.1 hypothetical protein Natgr_2758 [Natronobacterium gregoryi SP2]ELY64860.1 hypothetical protein C490_14280 [Natronobacterium gregoryi SP2]SFJ59804.1 hypothetical protein SAMN05443661_14424 [Natronobacterium gregoryi]
MVSDRDSRSRRKDNDGISAESTISRRHTLQAGVVTAVSLSGCLGDGFSVGDDTADSGDGAAEEPTDDADSDEEDDASPDDDPLATVYAYLEAAVDEDLERMSELSHSDNPVDPAAWVEEGWEFRGGGDEEALEAVEMEVVDDDATLEDVFELEGAAFWFDEEELAETLEGEDVATVEIVAEEPTEDDMVWLLATEDGDWRYLFAAEIDDTPDDPEEAFDEQIEDEDDDVVVEIDWEYDSPTSDVPQAAVEITEERGVEANRIEIDTTIEGRGESPYGA